MKALLIVGIVALFSGGFLGYSGASGRFRYRGF